MAQTTLLILGDSSNAAGLSASPEWQELLSDYSIIRGATWDEAQPAIGSTDIACALILDSAAGEEPLDILEAIHLANSNVPVVFCCAKMTSFTAVRLIRAGAAHCFDSRDSIGHLRDALETTIGQKRLQERIMQEASRTSEPWRASLVGDSIAMEAVAETIRLVGRRRCTVLITGETGTGKEMAARALHLSSPRSRHPMVAVNCSALPDNLLEAELFGHTKGAFTGAANLRIGRFEQANQGTIFLDEIGDMPLDLQAKLLRVLQDREVQRLGSSESIKIDVRVIAATNVDLQERVRQGMFRADLFYRLNVVPLHMPSLRNRTTDIPMLVSHFIRKICHAEDIPLKRLSPEAMSRLCASPWPGNVRQLENAVEMALAVSGDRDVLCPKDFGLAGSVPRISPAGTVNQFPLPVSEPANLDTMGSIGPQSICTTCRNVSGPIHFDTAVSQFQLAILDAALRQSGGNKTVAAQRLGIKRTTLIMKMRSLENPAYLQKAS